MEDMWLQTKDAWPGVATVGRMPPGEGLPAGYVAGAGTGALGWPAPPRAEAYHGLAGDIVRAVAPATEADPVPPRVVFPPTRDPSHTDTRRTRHPPPPTGRCAPV